MPRILIAEDDEITQKTLYKTLNKMGHIVFISPDGLHAYQSLKSNNKFDLLITDIMMPIMNGKQLIDKLRKDPDFKNFPIIIMSSVVGVSEITYLLKSGASIFMPKPLDKSDLEDYIKLLLEK